MMDNLINCLNDIWKLNIIYTIILLAAANDINDSSASIFQQIIVTIMNFNTSSTKRISPIGTITSYEELKPSLLVRIVKRLALITDNLLVYLSNRFNEHTATSIASFSVLIIVLSIICCIILSLMREEERRIKEQYKKLNAGSSQSFIASNDGGLDKARQKTCSSNNHNHHQYAASNYGGVTFSSNPAGYATLPTSVNRSDSVHKLHLIELRRETYFGLVRLLKPGCRTVVLLCDAQSRLKLLTKFYQCIYPYRRNKTLQFAFLLIEKNIGWYKDLLSLALNEKRDLHINPINCIGTVLVLNGFKKYFSVYHASDSRCDPDEPFILLEESLLDNFSDWLERLFVGKASRYYVRYWPDQMR